MAASRVTASRSAPVYCAETASHDSASKSTSVLRLIFAQWICRISCLPCASGAFICCLNTLNTREITYVNQLVKAPRPHQRRINHIWPIRRSLQIKSHQQTLYKLTISVIPSADAVIPSSSFRNADRIRSPTELPLSAARSLFPIIMSISSTKIIDGLQLRARPKSSLTAM